MSLPLYTCYKLKIKVHCSTNFTTFHKTFKTFNNRQELHDVHHLIPFILSLLKLLVRLKLNPIFGINCEKFCMWREGRGGDIHNHPLGCYVDDNMNRYSSLHARHHMKFDQISLNVVDFCQN